MSDVRDQVKKVKEKGDISKDILEFLDMIADNTLSFKNERDVKNDLILKLFDEDIEFELTNPNGTKKIGSKVIQQAMWRLMSKVKFMDVAIHRTGGDPNVERLVTEGIMTVADRGGLGRTFRDKGGVFQTLFLLGDAFLMFGKGKEDDTPVEYQILRNYDCYFDEFADSIRGSRPATKCVVIQQFHKEHAYELFPILKKNKVLGRIPGTYIQREDRRGNRHLEEDLIEIAWGFNRSTQKYIIFAGNKAFEVERFEDDEYPFIKKDKPYIPVFQFICQPSYGKFYNKGVGAMVYDLAIITRKLLNMEVGHVEENSHPFTLINAPQAKVDELLGKFEMAARIREQGGKPVVAYEFDPNGGQQSVNAQALVTQNLFNEWSAVWDRLYRELSRLGVNLDDIERGGGITRGQVIAEEQAANAFILQTMEYNGSEIKELIECTMDAVTEFVSEKNKSPLNLKTRLTKANGEDLVMTSPPTMGMLSKTLKDGNWFVVPDLRTGAMPSDLAEMLKEERMLGLAADPNERAFLFRQIASRSGIDLPQAPQQPQQLQQAPQEGGEAVAQPAGTQRVLPEPTGQILQPV